MSEQIHVRARKFLQEFFSDEELTNFCFDYFPLVYNDFTVGMPKSQKVRMVVEKSQRRGGFDELLAALERERPKSYAEHFAEQPQQIDQKPKPSEPIERNPRQIFISHAHQDAEFAQKLAADLRENGWKIWIAPDNIRPGEKWEEAINRGLIESAVFVLIISPESVKSRWVNVEADIAIDMEQRGDMYMLPLVVKPSEVAAKWDDYQWINFD
ncbi:MAG: TIR domain-containing protein [Candidatus Promineifilaceae bacterium]